MITVLTCICLHTLINTHTHIFWEHKPNGWNREREHQYEMIQGTSKELCE